jgi:hypothetical protein
MGKVIWLPKKLKEVVGTIVSTAEEEGVLSVGYYYDPIGSTVRIFKPNDDFTDVDFIQEDPIPVLEAYGFAHVTIPQKGGEQGRLVVLPSAFDVK